MSCLYNTIMYFYFKKILPIPKFSCKWKLQNLYVYCCIIQLIIVTGFLVNTLCNLGSSCLSIFPLNFFPIIWNYLQDVVLTDLFSSNFFIFTHIVLSSLNAPSFFTEFLLHMIENSG